MRILIIGALGYLGGHILRALRARGGHELFLGTRRPFDDQMTRVDLGDPETFGAFDEVDLVIDASDSTLVEPDEAIAYCLGRGKLFVETTSEPGTLERLTDRFHGRDAPGALILGAGIFPGLSNLIGAQAAAELPAPCEQLELGIAFSPLSAGGQGMVYLAGRYLRTDAVHFESGRRRTTAGVRRGPKLPFPNKDRRTIQIPFGEPVMLHASLEVPEVTAYMAPLPGILRPAFTLPPTWLLRNPLVGVLMTVWLTVLRRVLLSWRATPVELVAVATSRDGEVRIRKLRVEDGMRAAGEAVAALVDLLERGPRPRGGVTLDEVTSLEEFLPRLRRGRELVITTDP